MKRAIVLMSGVAAVSMFVGCTSYYKVTDPASQRVYYTTKLDKKDSGSVVIEDGKTGNEVTLTNSDVEKINKNEYDAGLAAPEPMATTNP